MNTDNDLIKKQVVKVLKNFISENIVFVFKPALSKMKILVMHDYPYLLFNPMLAELEKSIFRL